MEKYIERAILSVIKQKFQNFEIIIVNDNSNDNSKNIIKDFQTKDNRIKIIEHNNNLGVYSSRIEGVFNSRGVYIMLFDPDDMVVNPDLFQRLYRYNSNNLDIIEFSVLHQKEGKDEIILPNRHSHSHFHNFNSKVINQPELSEIIFYVPNTKQYTAIICRTIWNKIIRKKVILKAINYIERDFNNQYLITADDISLNSMSRGKNGKKHEIITCYNYLLFYKLFYRYIKNFKKDFNYLYFDLKAFYYYLLKFKKFKALEYYPKISAFFNRLKKENISKSFKMFIDFLLAKYN